MALTQPKHLASQQSGRFRNGISVRVYIAAVLISCFVGGSIFTGTLFCGDKRVEATQVVLRELDYLDKELERFDRGLSHWALHVDLIEDAYATYFIEESIERGETLLDELERLRLAHDWQQADSFVALDAFLDSNTVRLERLKNPLSSSNAERLRFASALSALRSDSIDALRALGREVISENTRVRINLETVVAWRARVLPLAVCAFAAWTIAIWFGATVSIARPLDRLLYVIDRMSAEGIVFEQEEAGPLEVRQLAASYLSLNASVDDRASLIAQDYKTAAKEARDSEQAKSEFLANMSHEIRTPMNGIVGMNMLLYDTNLDDEQRRFSETIKNSADALLVLLNDILDFSKIEAGKLEFENIEFDVAERIEEVCDLHALKAQEKELEFVLSIPMDLRLMVAGDPYRFSQILNNLIGNAIKFTDSGEIEVGLAAKSISENEVDLVFSVRDSGIGISKEGQEKLFKSFSQVDSSTTRKFGGTGLGLSISQRLSELMGGRMWVESIEGRGSTFFVSLPFARSSTADSWLKEMGSSLAGQRLYILDENARTRQCLREMLSFWHCEIVITKNSRELCDRLSQVLNRGEAIDGVFIDSNQPDEVRSTLQDLVARFESPPRFMLMHPMRSRTTDTELLAHGFDANVSKPIKPLILIQALAGDSNLLVSAGMETNNDSQVTLFGDTLDDIKNAKVLLVDDDPTNRAVATGLLKKLEIYPDISLNGKEAIWALGKTDYDLVFMDCQMPEMDGYEATGVIRDPLSSVLRHDVPVIAMTANAMSGDRFKCIQAGMTDYISKPIDANKLEALVKDWHGRSHVSELEPHEFVAPPIPEFSTVVESEVTVEPEAVETNDKSVVDLSDLIEMFDGDDAAIKNMVEVFVKSLDDQLAMLRTAVDGDKDIDTMSLYSHAIKGGAATCGAMELSELAAEMEDLCLDGNMDGAVAAFDRVADAGMRTRSALKSVELN